MVSFRGRQTLIVDIMIFIVVVCLVAKVSMSILTIV